MALEVLLTQRPDVAHAVSRALYFLQPEVLDTTDVVAVLDEWLAGDRKVPSFDAHSYPQQIDAVDAKLV
ncbi:hypothetical protein [Nocardioides sambongensis]|uniref:hypothetical protein n=1 Tax=Nocardioides sambongensis TaxID=2589074 RepID=UPI00112D1D9B|nr:hypothetical protein [Nocardioides sambongensis]